MKKILQLFTIAILFSVSTAFAQDYTWAKGFGDTSNELASSVSTTDAGGNVYIAGNFAGVVDFDPGPGTFNLSSDGGSQDSYVAKFDPNGIFLWASAIGGSSSEYITGIAVDASGYPFVCGYFYSSSFDVDPGVGTQYLVGGGGYSQAFIMKFDQSGGYNWAFALGGGQDDYAMSIAIDASSNTYITGSYQNTADFDPTGATVNLSAIGFNDVFVMKVDAFGALVWAKSVGGTTAEVGNDIAVSNAGNVYVTGAFTGSVDFDPGAANASQSSQGNDDVFLLKLDGSGNYAWAQVFGAITGLERGQALALDAAENIYVGGDFSDVTDFDPSAGTSIETPVGSNDCFVSKFDVSGNFLWDRVWGSSTQDYLYAVTTDAQGNVYSTGSFSGVSGIL